MTTSDAEFLNWIAKRLLYKYKDDPVIISRLEKLAREIYSYSRSFDSMSKKDYSEVEFLNK